MTTCGSVSCIDDDAYCCLDDYGTETCCITYYYYQTWWFWFMWAFILLIVASCFIGCFRACRTRRNQRYVILGQQQAPVYGSVVVSTSSQVGAAVPGPIAPVGPPAYVPYPQEKPPAYAQAFP